MGANLRLWESSLLDTASAPKEMSHTLVIVEVDEDFNEGEVTLASAQIEAQLAAKFDRQSDVKVKAFSQGFWRHISDCLIQRKHLGENQST